MTYSYCRLDEVADVVSGATPSTRKSEYYGGSILWATPKDLSRLDGVYLEETEKKITDAGYRSCSTTMLPAGSVLFSSRAPIGLLAIALKDICTNQGFKSLVCDKERIHPEYLYYCLRHFRPAIQNLGRGATFTEVSKELVGSFQIPVPPLNRQKEIAGVLYRTEQLVKKRRQTLRLADELLKSAFLEVFGDIKRNDKKWEVTKIGDALEYSQYGTSTKGNNEGKGYPILGMGNITYDGNLDLSKVNHVELNEGEFKKLKLERGDVIFNRTNSTDLVGKTTYWDRNEPAVLASYLVKLRLKPNLKPEFFSFLLNTAHFKHLFTERCKKAVGQSNISPTLLKEFDVFIPPLDLQKKFAALVQKVERLKEKQKRSEAHLQTLFNSLMQKAFRGEL
jgi:type I restriction enzyme S subunit